MAQIEFDACGFSERQHVFQTGERTFKQKSDPSPPNQHHPPLFHSKGSVHWFNSQESQLKARTGLTYIQWCEIDQRHPAWTNHSTEGEASKQTWKVQEAMTGLMVWKMLLMIEEKRVRLCLYPLIYLACRRSNDCREILKLFGGWHSSKDGRMDRWVCMSQTMSDAFTSVSILSQVMLL